MQGTEKVEKIHIHCRDDALVFGAHWVWMRLIRIYRKMPIYVGLRNVEEEEDIELKTCT